MEENFEILAILLGWGAVAFLIAFGGVIGYAAHWIQTRKPKRP
jgi:hypothetical protein